MQTIDQKMIKKTVSLSADEVREEIKAYVLSNQKSDDRDIVSFEGKEYRIDFFADVFVDDLLTGIPEPITSIVNLKACKVEVFFNNNK